MNEDWDGTSYLNDITQPMTTDGTERPDEGQEGKNHVACLNHLPVLWSLRPVRRFGLCEVVEVKWFFIQL